MTNIDWFLKLIDLNQDVDVYNFADKRMTN